MLSLKCFKEHVYDGSVIKALLYTVSLYPIGTFVYLSNRKVAEVIDTNPDNPKTPVVQLLTEKEADGSLKTIQIGENNINILRILTKQEKEDILKIVREKYNSIENAQTEAPATQENKTEAKAQPEAPAQPVTKPEQKPQEQETPAEAPAAPAEEAAQSDSSSPDGTEEVDISIFS